MRSVTGTGPGLGHCDVDALQNPEPQLVAAACTALKKLQSSAACIIDGVDPQPCRVTRPPGVMVGLPDREHQQGLLRMAQVLSN